MISLVRARVVHLYLIDVDVILHIPLKEKAYIVLRLVGGRLLNFWLLFVLVLRGLLGAGLILRCPGLQSSRGIHLLLSVNKINVSQINLELDLIISHRNKHYG